VLIISGLFVKLFPDSGKINREFFLSVDPEDPNNELSYHPSTLRARMHKPEIVRPETKEPN
jgi:hypothetical protein